MALIDKASLLMVPSTYEAGKLYNVLPSGNRAPDNKGGAGYDQTRADFDFDRGSNAAATRIGSDGLLKKYQENLLTQSNNFSDSDWTKTGIASVTGGEVGYDGSNDAYLITSNASTINHYLRQSGTTQSGVQTYSIYAKGNGYDVQLRATGVGTTTNWVSFNLVSGSVGTSGAGIIESKMTSLGNGWYRCSAAFNDSGSPFIGIYMVEDADTAGSGPSYTGDGVSGIFLQNAQAESGLVATDYLNSTSVTGKAGVLVDLPRINYDANGENGALLLEPQRVNLISKSEYISSYSSGGGAGLTMTANYGISPEGVKNSTRIQYTSGNSYVYSNYATATASGQSFNISIYAKGVAGEQIKLHASGSSGISFIKEFTLSGEWQRFDATGTTGSAGQVLPHILIGYGSSNPATDFEVYGWQCEAGSYSTSYIPNHGTSGGVTRAADSCTGGGSAESINSVEGVLYAEIAALSNDGTYRLMNLIDDSNNDNFIYLGYKDSSNTIRTRIEVGGAASTDMEFVLSNETEFNKIAVKWKTNDFALWVNGIEVATDSSGVSFTANTLDKIDFDRNGNLELNANVKQLAVFNEALTDSELATLTTL